MLSLLQAQLPAGFVNSRMQAGYTTPMGVAFSKNGQKMFVWEKSGLLWVSNWNGTAYTKQATPVLNLSAEVGNWRDFGLQSFVLDPNFDTNGLIYLSYQVDRHHLLYFGTPQYSATTDEYFGATVCRVTRYKLIPSGSNLVADATTRFVLMGESKSTGAVILHESHGGGQIIFGTDGTLLVSTGDGADFFSTDLGSDADTYWQQALTDGMIRPSENVGAFRSQMLNSFSGKLFRLDPSTGNGLASNPYYNAANPRSAQSRVWALGLRNPYRITLKTDTGSSLPSEGNPGTVLIGDVQWGSWEEMTIVEKGGVNCGWPLFEGLTPLFAYSELPTQNMDEVGNPTFASLCPQATAIEVNPIPSQRRFSHFLPALDWSHLGAVARYPDFSTGSLVPKTIGSAGALVEGTPFIGNASTAGTYYTGTAFPANYRNVYFFADYGANWIKAAVVHDNSDHQLHEIRDFAPNGFAKGIVDIDYCPLDGSIAYVNINTGEIMRISYGVNNPPNIVASAAKNFGTSPLVVSFNSIGTSDPDGDPITYEWNFGDGTPISTLPNPIHTFTGTGIKAFPVKLTVKDNKSLAASETINISINNTPPVVKITSPVNNSLYTLSQATNYTLRATVTDNNLTGIKYAWQVTLRHNNHEHREPVITTKTPTVLISPVGCDGETYYFMIELTVTDNGGLSTKDSVKIFPDCSSANLNIKNFAATRQTNAMRLTWVNPSVVFDEIMIVAKPNTVFLTRPSGTAYTANANYASNLSTPFEGGKVVYKGKATAVNISNLTGGIPYYFRAYTRKGTTWTGGVEISAIPLGAALVCEGDGRLYVETWNGIAPDACTSDVPIATPPTTAVTRAFARFELPNNVADSFGMRIRGFICAPETGNYTFYIASDDGGDLFLSTNTDAANKRLIAEMPGCSWAAARQWTKHPEQQSIPISLVAGQKYYVEVIFKEGTDDDNLAVGWRRPSNTTGAIEVIPASSLTPFVPPIVPVFNPNTCYRLYSRLSDKVMQVTGASLTEGTNIEQRAYVVGAKHQLWKFKPNTDGSYRIMNANSGLVTDISGGVTTAGAPAIQWNANGDPNQNWVFTRNTEGYYRIVAKHSNMSLSVAGNSLANGALLVQNPSGTTHGQQWEIAAITCPAGVVASESAYLLAAQVYKQGKNVLITWVSRADEQNDYFFIEKWSNTHSTFEKNSHFERSNRQIWRS